MKSILRPIRVLGNYVAAKQYSTFEINFNAQINRNASMVGSQNHRQYHRKDEPNVIYSDLDNFIVPNYPVIDHVWKDLDKWPDKTAVVCGITGHGYTYSQVYRMSYAFAACLRNRLAIVDNDCLAIMLPNSPEYPVVTMGALQAGCIVTTVNPAYLEDDVAKQMADSNTKVIVTTTEDYKKVKNAANKLKKNIHIIVVEDGPGCSIPEGAIRFSEFAQAFSESTECLKQVRRCGDDTAILPYSSGTTGLPKGVELTHKNITCNSIQIYSAKIPISTPTTESHQDVLLCVLPFFHIYGLNVTMLSKMTIGSKLVTLPKFNPKTFIAAQEKYRSNLFFAAPPLVLFLTNSPDVKEKHLETLETVISGAAPLARNDIERFLHKSKGTAFVQGYGLTETSSVVTIQDKGSTNYDSIGRITANCSVQIVDTETSKLLGPNQIGELWARGPHIMKSYYNNPKATEETLVEGGWLRTGDMGYYDDNHNFYITDRLKELIKVKGFQVPPAELEGILRSHPDLIDAGVVGLPHPKYGEIPKAFVVAKPGKTPNSKDIKKFVDDKVAEYKRLGDVEFLESIPKSAAGKILRRELKKMTG